MSSARVRGYLRTAATAAREGRDHEATVALRLATDACAVLPANAPERTELAVTRGEVAQWAGDPAGAADAFSAACDLDRAAHRVDALATVRRMRAALAQHAAGRRADAVALAEQAVTLAERLGDDLQAEARSVRTRVQQASLAPPPAGSVPPGARPAAAGSAPTAPGSSTAPPGAPATADVDDLLQELDELVGLAPVKAAVRELVALAQVAQARSAAGLSVGERTRHLAMVGAPGTGKTTVARLLGRIYGALGVVGEGQLVEVTRADLVAGFVGQTAQRTNEACDRALGGVLFVDEAYSLVSGGSEDFGHEALAELVKRMEDDRGRLVVVLAGYPAEMESLISANSGLRSRLQQTLVFDDYAPAELAAIFDVIAEREGWKLTDGARDRAHRALEALHARRDADWANARTVRTFFETCLARHAVRVTADGVVHPHELDLVEEPDIPEGPDA